VAFSQQNAPNSFSVGALPRTRLVDILALPRHPRWFKGALLLKEEGEEEGKGYSGGEGKVRKGFGR